MMLGDHDDEEVLAGGNASGPVVRVGSTVRKPWLPSSLRTGEYLHTLLQRGIDVPEPRGRDDRGRLILDYIPGCPAASIAPLDSRLIARIGALVRRIHDASTGLRLEGEWEVLIPIDRPDLLCHNDLATWNLIIDGSRLVFIDWDGAGPSTRLWDLAYAATSFADVFPGADVRASATRLAGFVEGYAADAQLRAALPEAMARRAMAMHDLLRRSHESGREPWATMYIDGHGAHWADTAAFIAGHATEWREAMLVES